MIINTNQIVTMTQANQNFSKASKIADNTGAALILKNNRPKYIIIDVDNADFELTDDAQIDIVAKQVLRKYKPAFKALAK